jgi:hypothetical protein
MICKVVAKAQFCLVGLLLGGGGFLDRDFHKFSFFRFFIIRRCKAVIYLIENKFNSIILPYIKSFVNTAAKNL